ncbi:MAG: hybrid sensor histidine kinase/response regulator [Deltaproteobacteria bacterium]|nr:hybrid sensor histidine kinase/response regulator [Deltaproteobacteria bacterium]
MPMFAAAPAEILNILLVEDNPHDQVSFGRALRGQFPHEINTFCTAEEVLALPAEAILTADVIVVDHGLPGLSGQELCRELQRHQACPPLVALTGQGSERLAVEYLKGGVADYLVKDWQGGYLEMLPMVLREVVRRRRESLALQNAELELMEAGVRRRTLLDGLAVGVLSLDHQLRVVEMNRTAEELTGWRELEALGHSCRDVLHADLCQADCPLKQSVEAGRAVGPLEASLLQPDGRQRPLSYTLAPVLGGDGVLLGAVAVFQDISLNKALEQERSAMLSMLVHDMKTPLVSIKGFAGRLLAKGGELNPEQHRTYLEIISREAGRLQKLVLDFLESSRQNRGGLALDRQPHDLAALVVRLAESFAARAEEAGVAINLELPPGGLCLTLDPVRLEQALGNLLDNALAFSPAGGRVRVCLAPEGAGCRLEVADQGPGISPEDLPQLFRPFFRSQNQPAKRSGFGLGLAGVKSIVESHNGHIEVISQPGRGSRFVLHLPAGPEPGDPA